MSDPITTANDFHAETADEPTAAHTKDAATISEALHARVRSLGLGGPLYTEFLEELNEQLTVPLGLPTDGAYGPDESDEYDPEDDD